MSKDKMFAYFSKSKVGQSVSFQSNGVLRQGNPKADRTVLVELGDKCVAPAKSKPKRRKTVKSSSEQDNDRSSGTEAISWTNETYTVRHLVKQFSGQFPLIARVDQGYCRDGVVDLARGQVLLVSEPGKQKQVLATDRAKTMFLSIPLDYQMDVILTSFSNELWNFKVAMKEKKLPVEATVFAVSSQADTTPISITGQTLTFIAIKDTVYLRANTINQGWIDQSEIIVIPESFPVEFSVAEGLQGASEQEWIDYQGMFSRGVRHLDFQSISGYSGILREQSDENDQFSESVFDSETGVKPSGARQYENVNLYESYIKVTESGIPSARGHEKLRSNGEDVFEDEVADIGEGTRIIDLSQVRMVLCKDGTLDYKRPKQMKDTVGPGSRDGGVEEEVVTSPQTDSDAESSDLDEMFQEMIDLNKTTISEITDSHEYDYIINDFSKENTDKLPTDLETIEEKSSRVGDVNDDKSDARKVPGIGGGVILRSSGLKNFKNEEQGCLELRTVNADSNELHTEKESKAAPVRSTTVMNIAKRFQAGQPLPDQRTSSCQFGRNENQPEQAETILVSQNQTDRVKSSQKVLTSAQTNYVQTTQNQSRQSQTKPLKPPDSDKKSSEISREKPTVVPNGQNNRHITPTPKSFYSSNKEKEPAAQASKPSAPVAQVKPNRFSHVQSSPLKNSNNHVVPGAIPLKKLLKPVDVEVRSSADVPSDLERLSTGSVCQCLQLLDLAKYSEVFTRNGVEGKKLTDMTEKVLERDFSFTPLEASKLIRFVKGWRP